MKIKVRLNNQAMFLRYKKVIKWNNVKIKVHYLKKGIFTCSRIVNQLSGKQMLILYKTFTKPLVLR